MGNVAIAERGLVARRSVSRVLARSVSMLVLQNYGAVDPEHLHELGDAHGRDEGVAVVDADADDGARLGVRRRVTSGNGDSPRKAYR